MCDRPRDGDRALHDFFSHLVRTHHFDREGLIDVVSAADAEATYRLVDERPDRTVAICFDWTTR